MFSMLKVQTLWTIYMNCWFHFCSFSLTTIAVDGLRDSCISYKVYLNGKNKLQALFNKQKKKPKWWKPYESNNELLTFLKYKAYFVLKLIKILKNYKEKISLPVLWF